jgi:hypothetical protein
VYLRAGVSNEEAVSDLSERKRGYIAEETVTLKKSRLPINAGTTLVSRHYLYNTSLQCL